VAFFEARESCVSACEARTPFSLRPGRFVTFSAGAGGRQGVGFSSPNGPMEVLTRMRAAAYMSGDSLFFSTYALASLMV